MRKCPQSIAGAFEDMESRPMKCRRLACQIDRKLRSNESPGDYEIAKLQNVCLGRACCSRCIDFGRGWKGAIRPDRVDRLAVFPVWPDVARVTLSPIQFPRRISEVGFLIPGHTVLLQSDVSETANMLPELPIRSIGERVAELRLPS